jgi:hypothetical protein
MITGVWKGKINKQKVEVKIIQNGDSLTGTSYYYESANNYRRYSIRGYFDGNTNSAVWWDDQLLEERSGRLSISSPGKNPMLSQADFNCPGDGRMMLDGKTGKKNDEVVKGDLHLDKRNDPDFPDEWDYVIDNYLVGGNDPYIIDSIASVHNVQVLAVVDKDEPVEEKPKPVEPVTQPDKKMVAIPPVKEKVPAPIINTPPPVKQLTIEEKFVKREKTFIKEIPVSGDSIELRFYDNAEIDGDSISLFLNDKLLFKHIRLTGNAYSIKLSVADLNESNELIMVAENLGAIPPNTSYMIAMVNGKRHDAYLSSTEGSSAMIKFTKAKPQTTQ